MTDLTVNTLYALADAFLDVERSPATVAGYMTHLARTPKWAADREHPVERGTVMKAMALLWCDAMLARSESRDRRPTIAQRDRIPSRS